jgi:hypothetical protein
VTEHLRHGLEVGPAGQRKTRSAILTVKTLAAEVARNIARGRA